MNLDSATPPVFMWHTWNDGAVPVENTLLFAQALRAADVSCEMHIFEEGNHGISVCTEHVGTKHDHCRHWLRLCKEWLDKRD